MTPTKLSVCITTYNHRKYIEQAIESVLMQETDFQFEIIIGEDDSNDGTRDIVKAYYSKYPDKIKLFLNSRKNVICINGKETGRWNFINNLKHAKGEYIALLDGDDYWIDKRKLQKQVDFLEKNSDYSICFHDAYEVNEPQSRNQINNIYPGKLSETNFIELLKSNYIHTCTVVYRNMFKGEFPESFKRVPMADWPLHVMHASVGKINKIDGVLSVYRIHENGIWFDLRKSKEKQLLSLMGFYEFILDYFEKDKVTYSLAKESYVYNKIHLLSYCLASKKYRDYFKILFRNLTICTLKDLKVVFFTSVVSFRFDRYCYIESINDLFPKH